MRFLFAVLCVGVLALSYPRDVSADDCAADNVTRVDAGTECLVIRVFGEPAERTALVVFIHGDGYRGGSSDYLYPLAHRFAARGIVAVGLIRPGYYDRDGNTSTGTSYRREGDGYRPHIVDAVAAAVRTLKGHYRADLVILAGHSGGAAISGVIIGKYPDLAQAAALAACPCNVPEWRERRRGHNNWTNSLSPHDFAADVATTTRVVALTGSLDDNTTPGLARDYVAGLTARGVDATFIELNGKDHNSSVRSDEFAQVLATLLEGRAKE